MNKLLCLQLALLSLLYGCGAKSDTEQADRHLTQSNVGTSGSSGSGGSGTGGTSGTGGNPVDCNNGDGCENAIIITPATSIPKSSSAQIFVFDTSVNVDCPGYVVLEATGVHVDCQAESLTVGAYSWDENSVLGKNSKEETIAVRVVFSANNTVWLDTGVIETTVTSTPWEGGGEFCGRMCYVREVSLKQ